MTRIRTPEQAAQAWAAAMSRAARAYGAEPTREDRIEWAKRSYVQGTIDLPTFEARLERLLSPEPPRNSGEADAVHGPTALGTQHDNTPEGKPADRDARP